MYRTVFELIRKNASRDGQINNVSDNWCHETERGV